MHNLIFSVESLESCSTDDYIIHCAVKGLNYGKLEVHVRPCIFSMNYSSLQIPTISMTYYAIFQINQSTKKHILLSACTC